MRCRARAAAPPAERPRRGTEVEKPDGVKVARRVFATFLAGALLAGPTPADVETEAAVLWSRLRARAAERALPATVFVRVAAGGEGGGAQAEGYGSGIVVRADGRVLTCRHVLGGAEEASVRLRDGREFVARKVAEDAATDLALLAFDANGLDIVTLGDEASVEVGETVLAVGAPFGLPWSVSAGILSAKGRRNVVSGNAAALLQTDAPLNPGSSGGPLLNLNGEVVGIVNAILTRSGGDQGLGFAVPSSEIRRVLPQLLGGRSPARGWIGIRVRADGAPGSGVRIDEVVRGGPAEAAGLRQGDLLVGLDARAIGSADDLRAPIRDAPPGRRLRFRVVRGDEILDLDVVVAERAPPAAP
jgi:serine protease Do